VLWGHLQVATLWKHEKLAPLREVVHKAGPEVLQRLDTLFAPKISTLDRLSFCALVEQRPNGEMDEPLPFFILRFREPFDPKEVVRANLGAAETVNLEGGHTVYRDRDNKAIELWFPDRQHIVIGTREKMPLLWKKPEVKDHPGLALLRQAEQNHATIVINMAALPIPDHVRRDIPAPLQPFLKVQTIIGTLHVADKVRMGLTADFGTAAAAREAEQAMQALCELGRQQLANLLHEVQGELFDPRRPTPRPASDVPEALAAVFMIGALKTVDERLAKPQEWVQRQESRLRVRIELDDLQFQQLVNMMAGVGASLMMLPAVSKVRDAASRTKSQNHLKQIGLAWHNFHDAMGFFPQDVVDQNGKPLLSWRVSIMPYIEEEALYRQFKLDEPWNSEHNLKLLARMPKIYESSNLPPVPGMTYYKAFSGPGAVLESGRRISIPRDIPDGTSRTIMVIEAGPAVPWTKPEDNPFDPKKPLPKLEPLPHGTQTNVLFCDGAVRTLDLKKIGEKKLRLLIMRNDGQPIEIDD
jgi:prepilin-type processing-associated H-X9-DG protein